MLKDNTPEYWKNMQQVAFDTLKEKLISVPIRMYPNFDIPFKLYTNASDIGLKAVLVQVDEQEKEWVIAYDVRRLNQAKRNYPTTKKECLAVV